MANTRKLKGHDIDWTAKETIRDAREAKGISRAELSRRLEIPIRTLENWDAGVNEPPAWAEKLIIEKIESM